MPSSIPTTQRAAQIYAGSDPISGITINSLAAVPELPKSGTNTLINLLYAAIDPIDYKLASAPWPVSRLAIGAGPIIPAQSFVGRVIKTSDSRFQSGDLVWGMLPGPQKFGTLAEYTVITKPEGISKVISELSNNLQQVVAASLTAVTALQTLQAGKLPYSNGGQGGSIFINGGSGGVGTFTVQMAKHIFNFDKVVVSSSGANAELVRSLGADEVVDYRSVSSLPGWLAEWTKKKGQFDTIIDNVGSDSQLYWQAHRYLKADGRYVQIGAAMSFSGITTMMKKMLWPRILGGGKRPFEFLNTDPNKEAYELIGQWLKEGKIHAVIEEDNVYELKDIKNAYKKLQTGRVRGKIVVKIGE